MSAAATAVIKGLLGKGHDPKDMLIAFAKVCGILSVIIVILLLINLYAGNI